MATIRQILMLIAALMLATSARAQDAGPAPEAATGFMPRPLAIAHRHMVAAANPLAAEAGREILRQGGSAVDAAIATQFVLGLVEPQSSGLGGGAFVVVFDAGSKAVTTYDGRETAPAAAKPDRFMTDGKAMNFDLAVRSGLSVGIPGTLRVLELAHRKHGRLPWARLLEPAITLAENGFAVSQRLSQLLAIEGPQAFAPAARRYFFDAGGQAIAAGALLKNPEYAATLKTLAADGADAFYSGAIAAAIVAAVAAPALKGDLTAADLAGYTAVERAPLCVSYRNRRICGMGPPSSGGIAVVQTLKLIEPMAAVQGPAAAMSAPALHAIAEAEKLAFADRNRYVADPGYVAVPSGLLDAGYLDERRTLIDPATAMAAPPAPGLPPGLARRTFGIDATRERAGTSHVSIADAAGNGVAMTTTIEGAFGSHQWAAGFLLNNEMTDFAFEPVDADGVPVANRVEAGKRPRSSMAPTLVLDDKGELEAMTGSPGGSRIIFYVVKTLVAMLDWGQDAAVSAATANFGDAGHALEIDDGPQTPPQLIAALRGYGHSISLGLMTSGVHTIARRNGEWQGGADPRREGIALGD